ncbi:MAG: hypothetical protein ABR969_05685 [Sedimentisphaerales bacterium]
MKKLITICSILLIVIAANANANLYVETFSSDNAGWLSGDQSFATLPAVYSSAEGNPAGSISCSLTAGTPLVFGLESTAVVGGSGNPETTWGNLTTSDTLTADFKTDGGTLTAQDGGTPMVRFYLGAGAAYSNTYFVSKDAYSWNPNDDTSWTTHKVALLAENFECMQGSAAFEDVIANLVDIGLQFGPSMRQHYTGVGALGFAGNATLELDNFGTIATCMFVLTGDFNNDCKVDFMDLEVLREQWLQPPGLPSADIEPSPSGDGIVNFQDFAAMAANWLIDCDTNHSDPACVPK